MLLLGGLTFPGGRRCAMRRRLHRSSIADRKSTRLNSSHSQISYAVFCLKKKKNTLIAAASVRSVFGYLPFVTACMVLTFEAIAVSRCDGVSVVVTMTVENLVIGYVAPI